MRIVSSSPRSITLASPAAEVVVASFGALCLLAIGTALLAFPVPPARWWSCRIGGGTSLAAGLFILLSTKYRRWTFDGRWGTVAIDTYGVFGRTRRTESDVEDVSVQSRSGYRGRRWNWFVLRKRDGVEIELGPTGHLGLDGARKTVEAVRRVLADTTQAPGEPPS